jgi:hypothetical protein
MYRSIADEEQSKQGPVNNNNNNVKMEDDSNNNMLTNKDIKVEVNPEKKVNNPFVKVTKDEGSKQKTIFEDLSKVSQSQNSHKMPNELINISQKIGFKKKANQSNEEKSKIDSQLQLSKGKKVN